MPEEEDGQSGWERERWIIKPCMDRTPLSRSISTAAAAAAESYSGAADTLVNPEWVMSLGTGTADGD